MFLACHNFWVAALQFEQFHIVIHRAAVTLSVVNCSKLVIIVFWLKLDPETAVIQN